MVDLSVVSSVVCSGGCPGLKGVVNSKHGSC